MASINKQSVREEFDLLQAQFEKLSSEGKMSSESQALFQAMLILFKVVMAIFMEKTTQKNNKNSSKPSSQTQKDESATTDKGSNSRGNNQNDKLSANTRTIETTHVAKVDFCNICHKDLSDNPCQQYERRTIIDIIFEKNVRHVDAEIKQTSIIEKSSKIAAAPSPYNFITTCVVDALNV